MGGCCCCASKSTELDGSPTFFHHPASEEREPLSSHHATVLTHTVGLLVDTNLDTSVPDTYQPPPAPIPYETYVGPPLRPSSNQESTATKNDTILQTTDPKPIGNVTNSGSSLVTKVKDMECDEKGDITILKDVEAEKSDELKKFIEPMVPPLQDEDDVCPTCLEEYDEENPRIITKCEHHFHLGCILEWMERSDTCPVCDQELDDETKICCQIQHLGTKCSTRGLCYSSRNDFWSDQKKT